MKRRIPISAALVLILIGVLVSFLITNSIIEEQYRQKLEELGADQIEFQKLATVDAIVREHYAGAVDGTAGSEASIAGYIEGLADEYSYYLTAEEYAEFLLAREEKPLYELGFSLGFHEESGEARVFYVQSTSQAATVGILSGDVIVSINDVTPQAGFDALCEQLIGAEGKSAVVTVSRKGETVTYTVPYAVVTQDRVSGSLKMGQTALIRIHSFSEGTKLELKAKIDNLVAGGADSLVFDVRGVSSLGFDEAIGCADVVAGLGDLARVMTKGQTVEVVQGDGASVPIDSYVLVDARTAGAPELFAACLRDSAKATIVGGITSGRASLQADIKLSDMSAIVLTTKIYLPPTSDSFHGVGLTPDLAVESAEDFRALQPEEETVFLETYYTIHPDRRPTGDEPPIVTPQPEGDDPTLIEPEM